MAGTSTFTPRSLVEGGTEIVPVLDSDRLRLRPLRETDADRMGELLTDERAQRFVGRYLAGDKVNPVRKIQRQLDRNARGEGYDWCIADRVTDRLIGHIHLWNLGGFDPTSAQLGYGVHPSARGRGVLTEALGMVVDWAFRPGGLRRVWLATAASNAASRHAAETAGFTHIASEPEAFPTGESGFEDSVIYHRLNPHWTPQMIDTFTFPDDVPTLTDGEVTLRAHQLSDVDQVVEQCTDPWSIRWTTVPTPYTRDMAVDFVTKAASEGWTTRSDMMFAIETDHGFSGTCSLRTMGEGIVEVAFGLHPAGRGRGVCTRAVKLLLDWGFTQDDIHVVVWYAYVGNWGSRRVAWANGFTFTGTVDKLLLQRGTRRDSWFGSLRKDDSREPKNAWHVAPVLETERLRLRPLCESDTARMGEVMADERTRAAVSRYLPYDRDGAATIMRMLESGARGERWSWCIADRETDRLLGHISLRGIGDHDPTTSEVGYSVHPDSRGRGVLTEALDRVVDWAFLADGGAGYRRLLLHTAESNSASRYAAEKTGFTLIATEPADYPSGESDFETSMTYHQLNQQWSP